MPSQPSNTPTGYQPRTYPQLTVKGLNPFYLCQAADYLFNQEDLYPDERFFPLLRFQQTVLILTTLFQFLKILAPSQSGKTTIAELIAAIIACTQPGAKILILSANEEQAQRVLADIRDKLIKKATLPELHELDKDSVQVIKLAATRAQIKAVAYSIKAVTGNPADFVLCDEPARWGKDADKVYAEAVARTGKTGGKVICISSSDEEGHADSRSPQGYRGNFYDYSWNLDFLERSDPNKESAAIKFSYHVSPFLVKNEPRLRKEYEKRGRGYFEAHMLCIPRKVSGIPVFQDDYEPKEHVISEERITRLLSPRHPIFVCYDPGPTKACVAGQLDIDHGRLLYLRSYLARTDKSFTQFVEETYQKIARDFGEYGLEVYADVASKHVQDQINVTPANDIYDITGLYPIMEYQHIGPGIDIIRSFMQRRNSFYLSDHEDNQYLRDAFSTGLVWEERQNRIIDDPKNAKYKKDGTYDHIGDAARYPPAYITGGYTASSFMHNQRVESERQDQQWGFM